MLDFIHKKTAVQRRFFCVRALLQLFDQSGFAGIIVVDLGGDTGIGDFDDGKTVGVFVIKFKNFRFQRIQKIAGGDAAFVAFLP